MSIHIGDLVKVKKGVDKGMIGIVLDYRHTGRFYPSIDLTIKLPNGNTIKKDHHYVQKLGETND